ncbi:hypothetical protein KSP40_PGU012445 [Platanthera guangdongensis]|uniref:Uncharacterized protein n=1 Tax=Platanthera guangdongensis TaxID=2320717 RepID=A0ABR2LI49_9ASPA
MESHHQEECRRSHTDGGADESHARRGRGGNVALSHKRELSKFNASDNPVPYPTPTFARLHLHLHFSSSALFSHSQSKQNPGLISAQYRKK